MRKKLLCSFIVLVYRLKVSRFYESRSRLPAEVPLPEDLSWSIIPYTIFSPPLPQEIFRPTQQSLAGWVLKRCVFGLLCQAKIVWVTLPRPFVKVRALRGGVSHLPWVFAQESRSPYRNKRLG